MLAAPLQSTSAFNDHTDIGTQYRPAKDLQAFNALLPPPIEFVKGSSTGTTLSTGEGKYQPINAPPKVEKSSNADSQRASEPSQASSSKSVKQTQASASTSKSLYPSTIDMSWPNAAIRGCGFINTGNTCFLNSALQCLLHTPPLFRILLRHSRDDPCNVPKNAFCMACSMRDLAIDSFKSKRAMVPYSITRALHHIAKTLRKGRQEDAHEFLRYAVDALQKSCLAGQPQKVDPKLAETTWVHKIFGGRLRSRVKCLSCDYNSDTFDNILDLSIDIYGVNNIRDALRKFVAVDHLRGADKYKCDKCKKHVPADKQFTLHDAPMVLTLHLKRFSPMGRKIGHPIRYDERISLQPIMSEGQHGPAYTLFGVVSHAGGGPNSGHYYAHVKDAQGNWYEMNDDSVTRHPGTPLGMKNAYILFYIREKGQALEAAVGTSRKPAGPQKTGLVAGMKKRKVVESDDEAEEERPTPSKQQRFIGPLLPPADIASSSSKPDPQAEVLKRKIAEKQKAKALPTKLSSALLSLSQYADDSDSDVGERVPEKPLPPTPSASTADARPPSTPPPVASTSTTASAPATLAPIPAASFYGSASASRVASMKKRKQPDDENHSSPTAKYARSPLKHPHSPHKHKFRAGFNPFSRLSGGNLGSPRKGKKPRHRKK